MLRRTQYYVLLVLLLASLGTALKLLHIDYMVNHSGADYQSFCNISATFNCDLVAASDYAYLFGIPIAFIGALGEVVLLVFLLAGLRIEALRSVQLEAFLLLFFGKTIASLVLAIISVLFVPSYCVLCMLYWALCVGGFFYLVCIVHKPLSAPADIVKNVFGALWQAKATSLGLLIVLLVGLFVGKEYFEKPVPVMPEMVGEHGQLFVPGDMTPLLGNPKSKLKISVYSDFECPACKRGHYVALDLVNRFKDQVYLIRLDFPLDQSCNPVIQRPFHAFACSAAYYSKCAGVQGKYWEFHDRIYDLQRQLSPAVFASIGEELSLDIEGLSRCVESQEVRQRVADNINEAIGLGVQSTPSFRIFGELYAGGIPLPVVAEYLENYPAIKPKVLERIYDNLWERNIQIVDLRAESDFRSGHLDGAINVPLAEIQVALGRLVRNVPILLYDADGSTLIEVYELLKLSGFDSVHVLSGGYNAWARAVASKRAPGPQFILPRAAMGYLERDNVLILDVRPKEMFDSGHLKGALNIPVEVLSTHFDDLKQIAAGKDILVYCRTTNRTIEAAQLLSQNGLTNLFLLDGGFAAWESEGLPLIR